MPGSKNICIYCSSSNAIHPVFFKAANELAALMAQRGHTLVYGGACVGLMGELARTIHHNNGKVTGVIPKKIKIKKKGICYEHADKLIITEDMRERKATMESLSDAFIALPGGFGTLEEVSEIITAKQLGFHDKPVIILNTAGYYDPLIEFFDHVYKFKFSQPESRDSYYITSDIEDCIKYIEKYIPKFFPVKFH